MGRQRTTLEWTFLAEGDLRGPWPPAQEDTLSPSDHAVSPRLRRGLVFCITLAVLLAAGIGVVYAHREAEQGARAIEQEVQAAAEAELWVGQNTPHLSASATVDDNAASYVTWMTAHEWAMSHEQMAQRANTDGGVSEPELQVQDTWFGNGVVAAELTLTQPSSDSGGRPVYRQTRFYRETADGWLRTKPAPALWGAPRTLETAHVLWRYRQRDDPAVMAAAGRIDTLFETLARDYDLALPMDDDKLVVEVQVDQLPRSNPLRTPRVVPVSVPSPAVYLVRVERTEAEILAQAVAFALLNEMWARAVTQHGIDPSWRLASAISLWELWETDLGLSGWKDELVPWALGDEFSTPDSTAVTLPVHYRELCAAYGQWMVTPFAVGLPLTCDSSDHDPERNRALMIGLRGPNLVLLQEIYLQHTIRDTLQWGNSVTLYTVFDYAVATYGRPSLPALVAALGRYDTWEALVPAVYGVSLDEFDAGWRTYWDEQYRANNR